MGQPEGFVSLALLREENLSSMRSARGHWGETGWQGPGGVLSSDWQAAEELGFAPRTELDLAQG